MTAVVQHRVNGIFFSGQDAKRQKTDPTPACITEDHTDVLTRQKNELITISQLHEVVSEYPESYPGLIKAFAEKTAACNHLLEDFMREVYKGMAHDNDSCFG